MLVTQDRYNVDGNVTGRKTAMGIAAEAQTVVMDMLAGMYANPVLAMIREYSTNASDAHIMAGQTRPIEVTLPSALAPFLKIKDFGVGLTEDDIALIYSQYGASTKRDTNEQNGTFGIGCKSALAYCSQFTVTSVKDGVKTITTVGRDEDGGGSMTTMDPIPTDEVNGTEVTIPVASRSDIDRMAKEAARFYRFWPVGSVLVNGKPPVRFEGLKLTDNIFVIEGEEDSIVVMGNVAYPAPTLNSLLTNANVVAFVPIGDVRIPPSREALMDTALTRATLDRVKAEFKTALSGAIQREVDACATPQDAIKAVVKWNKYVSSGTKPSDYTYKGTAIPTAMRLPDYDKTKPSWEQPESAKFRVSQAYSYRVGDASKEYSIIVHDWPTTVWVTDYNPTKFTAQHKRKLLKWCDQQGLKHAPRYSYSAPGATDPDVVQFVMCPRALPASPFIDPSLIVTWETVRKIKLEVNRNYASSDPNRIPGSYDVWTEDGYESGVAGDKLRQSYPIFYVNGNRWEGSAMNDAIKLHHPKYTLVCLSANRIDKFKRILPTCKEVSQEIRDKYKTWVASVTDDQKRALKIDVGTKGVLQQLDAGKIDDPDLREAIRVAKIDVSKIEAGLSTFQRYISTNAELSIAWVNPLVHYPLFEYSGYQPAGTKTLRRNPQHVYVMFNAIYQARQAGVLT